jgi:hypothetical protein
MGNYNEEEQIFLTTPENERRVVNKRRFMKAVYDESQRRLWELKWREIPSIDGDNLSISHLEDGRKKSIVELYSIIAETYPKLLERYSFLQANKAREASLYQPREKVIAQMAASMRAKVEGYEKQVALGYTNTQGSELDALAEIVTTPTEGQYALTKLLKETFDFPGGYTSNELTLSLAALRGNLPWNRAAVGETNLSNIDEGCLTGAVNFLKEVNTHLSADAEASYIENLIKPEDVDQALDEAIARELDPDRDKGPFDKIQLDRYR